MSNTVNPSISGRAGLAAAQPAITRELDGLIAGRAGGEDAGRGAQIQSLGAQAQNAQALADQMFLILDKFYSGEITAGMLAANPALQLWLQQAVQWENRVATTAAKLLEVVHDTRKELIRSLRA
jgi:hypothetical protein